MSLDIDVREIKGKIENELILANIAYKKINELNKPIQKKEAKIAAIQQEILAKKKEIALKTENLNKSIKRHIKEVKKLAKQHKKFLIKEEEKKTIEMDSGSISFRIDPPKVSIKNENEVIEALKEAGLTSLIRTIEEVDKEHTIELALRGSENVKEEIKKIEGLTITQKEELVIEPNLADKPITSQLKKWSVLK